MPEHEFPLIRIFLYMDSIYDSVLVRENTGHRIPEFLHVYAVLTFSVFFLQNKRKNTVLKNSSPEIFRKS